MSHTIPTVEPTRIRAGDLVKWTKYLADYLPDDGWSLSYELADSAGHLTVAATDNGDGSHLATITLVQSAALAPTSGPFRTLTLVGQVSNETEKYEVVVGQIDVYPSLSAAYDARTHAKVVLDAIEAKIASRASKDQEAVSLPDGRSISRIPMSELLTLRNHYRREYAAQLKAEGLSRGVKPTRPKMRF